MTDNIYMIDLVRTAVEEFEIAGRAAIDKEVQRNINDLPTSSAKIIGQSDIRYHLVTLLEGGEITVMPHQNGFSARYQWVMA